MNENEDIRETLDYLMNKVNSLTELVNQFASITTQQMNENYIDQKKDIVEIKEQLQLSNNMNIVNSPLFPVEMRDKAQAEIQQYIECKKQSEQLGSAFH